MRVCLMECCSHVATDASYILDGETVIASPVYGPENNDLILQLRKRVINRVILAGVGQPRF